MSVKSEKAPGFRAEAIDVFETCDLPEADQHLLTSGLDLESGETVEILPITPNEAFGRFKGAYIDSKAVDFSDKLRIDRRQGYKVVWSGEPKKDEETPLKKYQRLNAEVRELMDDVKAANTAGTGDASLDKVSVELEKLHCHLVKLRLEEVTGDEDGHRLKGGDVHSAKLMQQLKQFKLSNEVEGQKDRPKKEPSNQASYSLFMRPGQNEENAAMASLAARLSALESALGISPDQLSMLTMETGRKTLVGAVQVLSAKTALMDPDKLDGIEGRLGALQQKLAATQDNKSSIDTDRAGKLDEMIAAGERAKPLYDSLPEVIARLESLQRVHTRAGACSASLVQLDALQTQLSLQMANNHSLLQQTRQKFDKNLENINNNFESLFQRIEQVKKGKK